MWLGSSQQVRQIDIADMLVMSTQVNVVDAARDLGSSSTASLQYRHMSLHYVELVFFNSDSYDQMSIH